MTNLDAACLEMEVSAEGTTLNCFLLTHFGRLSLATVNFPACSSPVRGVQHAQQGTVQRMLQKTDLFRRGRNGARTVRYARSNGVWLSTEMMVERWSKRKQLWMLFGTTGLPYEGHGWLCRTVTQHFGILTFGDDAKATNSYLSHNLPTALMLPFFLSPSVIPFLTGKRDWKEWSPAKGQLVRRKAV